MKRKLLICLFAGLATVLPAILFGKGVAPAPQPFRSGDRVVFLGDSITHQGRWTGFVTRYYMEQFPSNAYEFINAGVGGDTARGCLCRLHEDVTPYDPTVIVTMFGMNDLGGCLWAKEFGPKENARADAALKRYEENLRTLAKRLKADCPHARLVWCTPSIYDDTSTMAKPCDYNRNGIVLRRAAEVVKAFGAERGEPVIDFNGPMARYNQMRQKEDPAFTMVGPDRVHPLRPGAFFMACEFLKQQGLDSHADDPMTPWPETELSKLLGTRGGYEGQLRTLAAVRWYLRNQKSIPNVDDMEAVKAFGEQLKAKGAKGFFQDRVPLYIKEWNPERLAAIRAKMKALDVQIERLRRKTGAAK